jgi:hypothetical protein
VEQVDHRPLAHSQEGRSDEERKEEEQRAEAEIIDAVRANDARLIEELFERVAGKSRACAWRVVCVVRCSHNTFFDF